MAYFSGGNMDFMACAIQYPDSIEVCWEIYCGCVVDHGTPTAAPTIARCTNGVQARSPFQNSCTSNY